jgi:hypothetical protein
MPTAECLQWVDCRHSRRLSAGPGVPYLFRMAESRFTPEQLRDKALAALEEAVTQCKSKPLKPTRTLRFALAFLGNRVADKTPFTEFWQAVQAKDRAVNPQFAGVMRSASADGALYRIYVALGLQRPPRG